MEISGATQDRTLGMVIGALIAYGVVKLVGAAPTGDQAIAIGSAAGGVGVMLAAQVPAVYRVGLRAAALLVAAALGVTVSAGCSVMKQPTSPFEQCYRAAGAYEVAQVAIEAAVTTPSLPTNVKLTLQKLDREAVDAAEGCEKAALDSDGQEALFYARILTQAVVQSRPLLAEVQ